MKKLLLFNFLVCFLFIQNSFGQNFTATYNFGSSTASSGRTDPTTVPTATGVTFGSFSASTALPTNPNASLRFSFTNQPTGATNGSDVFTGTADLGKYYEVTITPASGFSIDLSTIKFTVQRSGTGIRQYAVRSSRDGFAANLPASIAPANADLQVVATNIFQVVDASTSAETGATVTLTGFTAINSAVTFRFYGFNAEATGGTFSIDDVIIAGTANAGGDITPPTFTATYPKSSNISTNAFTLTSNINEAGTTYFVVLPDGAVAPNSSQVKLGNNASNTAALFAGNFANITANADYSSNITGLSQNTNYDVYVIAEDGIPNLQTTATKLDLLTTNVATPVITTTPASITFPGFTAQNKTSNAQSFTINGADLQGDVQIALTGNYLMSKTLNGTYANTNLTFLQSEFNGGVSQTVYVKFNPLTNIGNQTGSLTLTSTNAATKMVSLAAVAINPYQQDFNNANFLTNSGWSQVSVSGTLNSWVYTTTAPNSAPGAALMNGFSDTNTPSNDWLISPAMDLTAFNNFATLQFFSREFFAGPDLKLMVSTTYDGSGVINTADWTEINGNFPDNTGVWQLSDNINLNNYKSANTHVAFVYQTTAGGTNNSSEWKVDDFKVENKANYLAIPDQTFSYAETTVGNTSTSTNFILAAGGFGDITVTAPTNFQVSLNNTSFSNSIIVPQADALAGKTIFIRFAPTTKTIVLTGKLTFTGTGLNTSLITLTGSSILRSETFDIATYNIEFFGTDVRDAANVEFGPTNDALQITNVTTVLQKLNLDVIAVEEVSDLPSFNQLVANLPGYAGTLSSRYSYSFDAADPNFPPQQIGFIYNTATVTKVSEEPLFVAQFDAARAGNTSIFPNYPTGSGASFWSSGRLPFLTTFTSNIAGNPQTYRVVVIHGKSAGTTADHNRRVYDNKVLYDYLNATYPTDKIIILGDFNDQVVGSISSSPTSSYNIFVSDAANYTALTQSISQIPGLGTFVGGNTPSFIDHIMISNELNNSYISNSIAIEDPRSYISSYSTTTSDHLPVYARFSIPPLPTASISGNINVLVGATAPLVTFTGASGTAPYTFTYKLNNGSNQTITTTTGNAVTLSVPTTAAGTFVYTLVSVADANGNQLQTGTVIVRVNPLATGTITGNSSICINSAPQNVTFTGGVGTAPFTFTYTVNGSANRTISTTTGNSVTVSQPSNVAGSFVYTLVRVADANGSQLQTGTATITVNSLPVVNISSNNTTSISKGSSVVLSASGGVSYNWLPNTDIVSGQTSAKLTVRPRQTTTYTVTATNAAGCTSNQSITIQVEDDYKVKPINILTPNGDGKNDRFVIENIDYYPNNTLTVFDRAGRSVYTKKGYANEWDGTLNGSTLASDTYYYILDFGPNLGQFKGYITLIRN